ncbi:UBA-like protein [Nocardia bhagyanarayanae]|uniref:UBA-like protein n=1 Tax=Nocardia bhagyanarayanae TaxID=1215925 RepID=A0A543FA75_9NOCA|nr:UBA-like protein [Nocardia bhagyanarayanae]
MRDPSRAAGHRLLDVYNWDLQNAISAFVDSLRPGAEHQHELYMSVLYAFVDMQSHLLTLLGYPPVP